MGNYFLIYIMLIVLGAAAFIVLLTSLICFFKVFYFRNPGPLKEDEYDIPKGRIYEPYREKMVKWQKDLRALPAKNYEIRSFDGLTLRAKFFECSPGAPVELMFHGYQGNSERDLCGGVFRAFALGHSVLLIDHRAGGASEGNIVTFGINEVRDCLRWIDLAVRELGDDIKLILTGVSMGAATVMMASAEDIPENVKYVLADCGYSSAKEIIKKVIKDMRLPAALLYPFVKLGASIFGRFDLESNSPMEAVKKSRVPIIFFHGNADDFVPMEMSCRLYEACKSEKKLVIIEGAGHGLAYPADKETYLNAMKEFEENYL